MVGDGSIAGSKLFYFDERGEIDLSEFVTELSWEHKVGQIPSARVKLIFTTYTLKNAPEKVALISANFPQLGERIAHLKGA